MFQLYCEVTWRIWAVWEEAEQQQQQQREIERNLWMSRGKVIGEGIVTTTM